jgi:hypothetical protein
MHSAIVVVKVPEGEQSWPAFRATLKEPHVAAALKDQQNVQRLAENVWLVNFQNNQEALIKLVDAAARHQFSYGILQLDEKPQWLPTSFDPEVIPGEWTAAPRDRPSRPASAAWRRLKNGGRGQPTGANPLREAPDALAAMIVDPAPGGNVVPMVSGCGAW